MQKKQHEKSCEIKVGSPEIWDNGKFLIATIQVNLVPVTSEAWWRQHKLPELLLLKFYHHPTITILPSQPLLGLQL